MARVPLLRQGDLPEEYQYLMSEDSLGEQNIFRAMGNNPKVMQSYMRYGTTLWNDCGLTYRERELVILAAARALESRYEWQQHVRLGRDAGITDEELLAISRGETDRFPPAEQALISYGDAFVTENLTDAHHDAVAQHFETSTVTGTAMLASHYVATARVLDALDVPLEDDFVGWELEHETPHSRSRRFQ